jgi:YVTN family beta-propeller protein
MSKFSRPFATCLSLAGLVLMACASPTVSDKQHGSELGESTEALTIAEANLAQWSPLKTLPLVPASGANLPDGTVLLWSAENRFGFGSDLGRTYSVLYDPTTGAVTERLVSETGHDMFCPGTANLPDGRIFVNGGLSAGTTSIYDPNTQIWTRAANMNIARAYQGTAPLQDGSVFTLGGSWAGGVGNKHGEVWTADAWRLLPGVRIEPFLSADSTRNFGMDSHLWLFAAGNGRVFHAGPGYNMHWIDPTGNGRVIPAGRRGDDQFSINGNALMFDTGKLLKVGGAPGYEGIVANANSYVIDLNGGVNVRKLPSMAYPRAFHNSVVLPNGQVVIVGGATVAVGFTDNNGVLAPEIFDPTTETFTVMPSMAVARNYHSIALLLPDGRVLSAGGGLCGNGCGANHPDLQILTPPYLFNADGTPATRPVISSAPAQAVHGALMNVTTNGPVSAFSLVRLTSTTHAVNNDQRRLSLTFSQVSPNNYAVQVPTNPGWALPGVYMLFAMNQNGTPSIARTVRIGASTLLPLAPVPDQAMTVGASATLALTAASPSGNPLTFGATGLPQGLSINPSTGVISGSPTRLGRSLVEATASDGIQTIGTQFTWDVYEPGVTRFVRLEARSEVTGKAWASAAELNLLDGNGQALPRGAWTISADSAELAAANHGAANAIDGDPATLWHTQYQGASPIHPHWLNVDLGGAYKVTGLSYLPRSGGGNGTIAEYAVFLSADGVNWGNAVAQGNFSALGAASVEKTIYFENIAKTKPAVQSSTASSALAARAVDGNTNGVLASGSVSQTSSQATPFWEVDLGAPHQLFGTRIWNRTDCCGTALSNFRILASPSPMTGRTLAALEADPNVINVTVPGTEPAVQLHALSGRARYLRVQLAGTGQLALAEVEVHGRLADNLSPNLTVPTPPSTAAGAAVTLTLNGSDPDGDTLTYAASGLPAGLTLNTSSGVISGTATAVGNHHVTASVSDGRGGTTSVQFDWLVGLNPPTLSPVIAPLAPSGASTTFTANASGGGTLEYNWSFGDGKPDSGYTSSPSVSHTYATAGVYIVTLTVRNAQGDYVSTQFLQAITAPPIAGSPRSSSNIVEEVRAGLSPRVWVANIDNDTVSVFARAGLVKVAEIPVGQHPRSLAVAPDGRIWVANKGSSTLSVISPTSLSVEQTVSLPHGSQPFGVICAPDGSVYVVLEAVGMVYRLDATGTKIVSRSVGPNPRHIALNAQGDKLVVPRFISPPQPGESSAFVETNVAGVLKGGEVLVVPAPLLSSARTIVLRHSTKPDTTISGRGVPNYLGTPVLSPDGKSLWVPSKQDNIQRGSLRDGQNLDFQNTVRAIASRIDFVKQTEDYAGRLDFDNSGVASAAAYHPSGAYLFVALEASRQVSVVDAVGKRELFRVDAGLAPQGLAVAADGRTLYLHNAMSRSVSVFDLVPLIDRGSRTLPLLAELDAVAVEKLSPQALRGKQLFYDAKDVRLARDAYLSCASCHNDGGQDGRVWDLTGLGEGLRNTVSLRGRAGAQGRLHWTANFDEVQDFEAQIRTLAQGTGLMSDAAFQLGTRSQPLGDSKAGVSSDLDALAAYLGSLTTADPSPARPVGDELIGSALLGRAIFVQKCATCHGGADFSDSPALAVRNVGTLRPSSGTRLTQPLLGLDTPGLRGSWATAPYLHDGSAPTLKAAILAHSNVVVSNTTELSRLIAFVTQLGPEEPTPPRPSGLTAQYFPNTTFSPPAALTQIESQISVNYATGGPVGVPVDGFSARWTGKLLASTSGTHYFRTMVDDAVRLWVNGTLLYENTVARPRTTSTSLPIELVAGQSYDFKMEYQELGGESAIFLTWLTPGAPRYTAVPATSLSQVGGGLRADYFADNALTGSPVLTRYEAPYFQWDNGAPAPGVPVDNFSVRWSGTLQTATDGTYLFRTNSDDGVRLWVNGALVIDNWTAHGPTLDYSSPVRLLAGNRYDIKLEYQELGGGAVLQLDWQPPGATALAPLPASVLFAN